MVFFYKKLQKRFQEQLFDLPKVLRKISNLGDVFLNNKDFWRFTSQSFFQRQLVNHSLNIHLVNKWAIWQNYVRSRELINTQAKFLSMPNSYVKEFHILLFGHSQDPNCWGVVVAHFYDNWLRTGRLGFHPWSDQNLWFMDLPLLVISMRRLSHSGLIFVKVLG